MSHVTMLGCTLRVYPRTDESGESLLPDVLLNGTMEQEGDGRMFEVMLSAEDRRWLANELMLGLAAENEDPDRTTDLTGEPT